MSDQNFKTWSKYWKEVITAVGDDGFAIRRLHIEEGYCDRVPISWILLNILWWAMDVETEPSEVLDSWVRRPAGPTVNPRK